MEQDKDFKEQYKYDLESENEEKTVKQKIEELKNIEDVLLFLKNMYIEQYKKITGDTDLTTEDIDLWGKLYLDKVYVNTETGEMIPYDSNYKQVEKKLEEEGSPYEIKHDVGVYTVYYVEKNEINLIDCVALQSKEGETVPVKVMIDEQQFGKKSYTSILATMGTAIPAGFDYIENLEEGNENNIAVSKNQFIQALEEFENTKEEPRGWINGEEEYRKAKEEGLEHE